MTKTDKNFNNWLKTKKLFCYRPYKLPYSYKVLWLDKGKKRTDILIGDINLCIKEQIRAGYKIMPL